MCQPDPRRLAEDFGARMAKLNKDASSGATLRAFQTFHAESLRPGEISGELKEIIAIAIAVATHCEGCIAWHVADAIRAGVRREQILEAVGVAIMMGGGPALYYATKVHEALEAYVAE